MSRWIFPSLLALSLVIVLTPFTQRILCDDTAPGTCAGGGCGNLRALQEKLDRDTIRFGQSPDCPLVEIAQ